MTTKERTRSRSGATEGGYTADSMAFHEAFGFSRIAGEAARERFGVTPGDRVLDVGCGTGTLMRFLLPSLSGEGELVGVDHDPDLLTDAENGMRNVNVPVDFEEADALDLPFEDSAFDVVVSQFLLCVLPEPLQALKEMVRVCSPGGTIASISCFCKSGGLPRFHGVTDWDGRDRFAALDDRFRETYRTRIRNPGLGLPNGEDLAVWGAYHEAGLVEPRIAGYMPVFAPADADWTDAEVEEYARRRERIDLGLLDGLSEAEVGTLADHGLSRTELDELRDLTVEHYRRLLEEPGVARSNMDIWVDPLVLITGKVPDSRG